MLEGRRERKRRRTEVLLLPRVGVWLKEEEKGKKREKGRDTLYPRRVVSKDMCVNCVGWSRREYCVNKSCIG